MGADLLFIQFLNGLQYGVLLFLIAAGLTLVFGIVDFLNVAHGSFYMIGAYLFASFVALSGSFAYSALLTLLIVGSLGACFEILIARRLYSRGHLEQVLGTFGIAMASSALVRMFWGAQGIQVTLPDWLRGRVTLLGVGEFPSYRLLVIAVGLFMAFLLHGTIKRARFGMLTRAASSDREMLDALGVNSNALLTCVFALGAALAGLAGILIVPLVGASAGMGSEVTVIAFLVTVVGGLGSVKGAFVGAMFLGFIDSMSRAFAGDICAFFMNDGLARIVAPSLAAMSIYLSAVLILFFMPRGLFPQKTR